MSEHTIETRTHGRYLISTGPNPHSPVLIGFHGYGETAEEELERLRTIPETDQWTLVSVQGLHQFYRRRTNEVVASWMTRQNRELAIRDNVAYTSAVVSRVLGDSARPPTLILTGFSQGVAMAFRSAVALASPVKGIIACGGDVPPELDTHVLSRFPSVLIGRGARDEWYTQEKLDGDRQRLRAAGVGVETITLDAAHEWTPEFSNKCSLFLKELR